MTSAEVLEAVTNYLEPAAGHVYLVAGVIVENTDRDTLAYSPLYFQVKDSDGFEYIATLFAPEPTLKSGDLAKGDRARGNVAFEVKEGAAGLVLSFEPLFLSSDFQPIRFSLGDAVVP